MTPEAFREAVSALGLTEAQLVKEMGKSVRAIRRYKSGDTPVPKLVSDRIEELVKCLG